MPSLKLIPFIAILALLGCAPNQSTLDQEKAQIAANVAENWAKLNPHVGNYKGQITYNDKTRGKNGVVPVWISLAEIYVPVTNSGQNTVSEVPNLGGLIQELAASDESAPPEDLVYITYATPQQDPSNIKFSLSDTPQTGSTVSTVLPIGTLNAIFSGDSMSGTISIVHDASLGTIQVTRTSSVIDSQNSLEEAAQQSLVNQWKVVTNYQGRYTGAITFNDTTLGNKGVVNVALELNAAVKKLDKPGPYGVQNYTTLIGQLSVDANAADSENLSLTFWNEASANHIALAFTGGKKFNIGTMYLLLDLYGMRGQVVGPNQEPIGTINLMSSR